MEFDAEQRRQALRDFRASLRPTLKVARWEALAEIGDGTLRKFLARVTHTLEDKTYQALANAAGKHIGRNVSVAELQGSTSSQTHRTGRTPAHEAVTKSRHAREDGDEKLEPLLVYRTVPDTRNQHGGYFMLGNQVTDEVERPRFLRLAEKAYLFKVLDDNNAKVYRRHDTLIVDPEGSFAVDEDCLFTGDKLAPGGALSIVGCLVRFTDDLWIITQHAIEGEREISRAEMPNAMPIIGRYHRR